MTAAAWRPRRAALLALLLLGPACAPKQVTRVDPATTIDLSGRWNDTDSRLVAEQMIDDVLRSDALAGFEDMPVVVLGPVRTETLEHIPTETFLKDIEGALVRSGRVVVVSSPEEREDLRQERAEQQEFARPSTRAAMYAETGADVLLGGVITAIEDSRGGTSVTYYQVDLSLTDLESNEKLWVGQKKLKKVLARSRYKV